MHKFRRQTQVQGKIKAFTGILLCALALAACHQKPEDKKSASQIAAKVNGGEISIHQVNFVLQRTPGVAQEKTAEAKRQILDNLVDQELAVQQALEAKLDRDPNVMQTLEAARREVLARAYIDQAVAGKNKPSAEAVKTYYKEHPELFSNRRIYRLQEIGFSSTPEVVAMVREQIAKAKTGQELLDSLRDRGIKVSGEVMSKPAENISLDILPKLSQMKEGQSALFENGSHASIVTILSASSDPLTEEAARPLIEQFLSRRQANELAKETIHQLRDKAKIEYVGEFGKEAEAARKAREADESRKAEADKAAREAARLAQEAESAKRAEEMRKVREASEEARARSQQRPPPPSDSTISKGISSLK